MRTTGTGTLPLYCGTRIANCGRIEDWKIHVLADVQGDEKLTVAERRCLPTIVAPVPDASSRFRVDPGAPGVGRRDLG